MPEHLVSQSPIEEDDTGRAAERRAELMDRLDYKVEAVLDFGRMIESLDDDARPSEVHRALDQARSNIRAMFPPDTIGRFDRLVAIQNRLRQLHRDISTAWDDPGRGPDEQARRQILAEMQTLQREELPLLENEDLAFLLNMEYVIRGLQRKNNEVEALRDQPVRTLDELNLYNYHKTIIPEDIVRIKRTPFELSVVLKPKSYQRVRGQDDDSIGVHFNNSPFSLIRDGQEIETTMRHESIHNALDQAAGIRYYSRSRLKGLADHHRRSTSDEEKKAAEASLLQYRPVSLLNQMHNEMLAELENWERHPWNRDRSKILWIDRNRPRTFAFHAERYSTAGRDAMEVVAAFESAAKHCQDPAQRRQLMETSRQFQRVFTDAVEYMRSAMRTARSSGDEAVDRLHALLFVLPPSRYRHLARYLKFKYGDV